MVENDAAETRTTSFTQPITAQHGWQLVEIYERLGSQRSSEVFRPELDAWRDYAKNTVADLVPWLGAMDHTIYRNDNNRVRYRRTLDLIMPGESVFDVGFGRGYLCGLLLRDRDVTAYQGIDIDDTHVGMVTAMFEPNGLSTRNVYVQTGDVYQLNRETVAASGATAVMCFEVLEHVSDPERALQTLAAALPDGADLIFSVPLYGRLERVWGHTTVFDAARLKVMCESAGLFVHMVEPVANVWTFVVASRSAMPSKRVFVAAALTPSPRQAEHGTYDFRDVDLSQFAVGNWLARTECSCEPTPSGTVECRVTGHTPETMDTRGQYGGVTFPVDDLRAVRLRVSTPTPDSIEAVYVDTYSGSTRTARWRSKPAMSMGFRRGRRWAFRPGQDNSGFVYRGKPQAVVMADRVEVFVKIEPGTSTSFTLKAAYLPGPGR